LNRKHADLTRSRMILACGFEIADRTLALIRLDHDLGGTEPALETLGNNPTGFLIERKRAVAISAQSKPTRLRKGHVSQESVQSATFRIELC
jgi:hypothetical protein